MGKSWKNASPGRRRSGKKRGHAKSREEESHGEIPAIASYEGGEKRSGGVLIYILKPEDLSSGRKRKGHPSPPPS